MSDEAILEPQLRTLPSVLILFVDKVTVKIRHYAFNNTVNIIWEN